MHNMHVANPLQPTVAVSRGPLALLRPEDVRPAPVGATLWELMPHDNAPILCSVLGVEGFVLREQWGYRVQPGDVIVWHVDPPQGRDSLRSVLQLAVVALAIWNPLGWGALALAAFSAASSFAINALLPPTGPQASAGQQLQQPGNVYSVSLQGNQARLNEPIWKVCGRAKLTPPFAAEPYAEIISESETFVDGQQYYYAVFAVGVGAHDIEQALIGGTPIDHFADVLVNAYLPPGTQPSTALPYVVTSSVVSGQLLETGVYVGGFAACRPKRTCIAIGVDIAAPRGLIKGTSGLSVEWRTEIREIDDFGAPLGTWASLGTRTRTAQTTTPQRWSVKFDLPYYQWNKRFEVRVVRTDTKDNDSSALHELAWVGLRGYLKTDPPLLNPDTAHYEVVLRASDQLSQFSQRDISLIARAKARTWSSEDGWSAAPVFTRNPAWWLLDLASSAVWGLGLPDARIDLPGFAALAATCDARQDRFDYVFTHATDAWSAMQLIARSARARVFRRNGVLCVARDELATLGVTAFTTRNTLPGSMSVTESLPTHEMPDGFAIEYIDNRTWLPTIIECPCPGVAEMANPVHKTLDGITGATHAEREGLYEAANLAYRRRVASCKTEMQGVLPAFMSPVRWQPDIPRYGQTGDVCFWDADTLTMGLSEPVAWADETLYLTLIRDDGSLTAPVAVLPGAGANDVTLPAAPDFTLVLDDGTRERPKYLLGTLTGDELIKVTAIRDGGRGEGGEQLYEIEGLVDDPRVHAADNALLPGPGDDQDPIGSIDSGGGEGGGGGEAIVVRLSKKEMTMTADSVTYTLRNDGTSSGEYMWYGYSEHEFDGEWMLNGAVEPDVAALYEVRLVLKRSNGSPDAPVTSGDAVGSWLSLGTTRSWTLEAPEGYGSWFDVYYTVQIREASTGIIQDAKELRMYVAGEAPPDPPP